MKVSAKWKLLSGIIFGFLLLGIPAVNAQAAEGGREVPHYDIREEGGSWDETNYYLPDGTKVVDAFFCDGTYTYYLMADGTPMKDRLSYHPDGEHVIYFDEYGHEVFSDFANVKKSISGEAVDDFCFFDVYGYLYVDVVTYDKTGTVLYYANPYGVMERGKWFQFSDTVMCADGTPWEGAAGGYGYANEDGTLMTDTWTYDWEGRRCYMQGNGVALYSDGGNAETPGDSDIPDNSDVPDDSDNLEDLEKLDVRDYGAIPDDGVDDTDAINQALRDAYSSEDVKVVYVPAGTYHISINPETARGIALRSNTSLLMDDDTILEVAGTSLQNYGVLSVREIENVTIRGGQIKGERYKHDGSGGEYGMGIDICDSKNIRISDMDISANWGDGIYMGRNRFDGCDGISVVRCNIFDNRRSNISIVDADNVTINDCVISNANGTAPQCGINIEPNMDSSGSIPEDAVCNHIRITNTTINVLGMDDYYGQYLCFMTVYHPEDKSLVTARDIQISSCTFNGDCGNYSGADVTISDTYIKGTLYYNGETDFSNNVNYGGKFGI